MIPAVTYVLAQEAGDEAGVVAGVAPPQAPRLAQETVGPLQAAALHPSGSLRDETGVEVERRADPDEQWRGKAWAHPEHPLLLLGLAGADPHDGGSRGVDLGDRAFLLLTREGAEGG